MVLFKSKPQSARATMDHSATMNGIAGGPSSTLPRQMKQSVSRADLRSHQHQPHAQQHHLYTPNRVPNFRPGVPTPPNFAPPQVPPLLPPPRSASVDRSLSHLSHHGRLTGAMKSLTPRARPMSSLVVIDRIANGSPREMNGEFLVMSLGEFLGECFSFFGLGFVQFMGGSFWYFWLSDAIIS